MKYLVAMMVVLLFALGPAVLAEPIWFDSDSAPVNLSIACWVYVYFLDENASFDLEVEPWMGGDEEIEWFELGQNCDTNLWATLTPPPGAPGQWGCWIIQPPETFWWVYGVGTVQWPAGVNVSGLTILDPAGFYGGGQMDIYISCLD